MALCSIGIAGGIIGLVALAKRAFFHRRGYGGGSCGHRVHWRGGGHGPGRSWWLRALFSRLDTTPGQEKVIKEAFAEVKAAVEGAGGEVDQTRRDVAAAVRSGTVDETALGALFARHDEKLRDVQKAFVTALGKVNAAPDEDQRKRLAEMIDKQGGWSRGFGGPYRGAWA